MNASCRTALATLVALSVAGPLRAEQAADASLTPTLTQEEMSSFLQTARIGRLRSAGGGVTNSKRATLTDGVLTHDAHIQTVDVAASIFEAGRKSEANFKDSYRLNLAGYRLARLLALNVPVSVERRVDGKQASVTWWVDDVAMDERGRIKQGTLGPNPGRATQQLVVMQVWDELIQNRDRNQGNILWTRDWTMWLIDHTRAFRLGRELLNPRSLTRCDRDVLTRLRELTPASVAAALGDSISRDELDALMARRNAIVELFDDRLQRLGEAAVLFSMSR